MTTEKLKAGDVLLYVPSNSFRSEPHDVVVHKVGRKWATLRRPNSKYDFLLMDVKTRKVDGAGYASPGSVWRSRDEYDAHVRLRNAWLNFKNGIRGHYAAPGGVTEADIASARQLLKLDKAD